MDVDTISKVLNAGFGTLVVVGGTLKWFVFGWVYAKAEARADKYEALYYEMLRDIRNTSSRIEVTK